ncbi:hypothetical protein BDV37DRAFT_266000, partial [Aspergillus pseudonomiae]
MLLSAFHVSSMLGALFVSLRATFKGAIAFSFFLVSLFRVSSIWLASCRGRNPVFVHPHISCVEARMDIYIYICSCL